MKTMVLALALLIILPVDAAFAVVPSEPICAQQRSLLDSKKDILQKCIDQLSIPGGPSVEHKKAPPCVLEIDALTQAVKELRDCLNR